MCQLQTFCARRKDDLHSLKFGQAQNILEPVKGYSILPGGGMPGLSCGGPAPGGRTIKPPGAATCMKAGGISPGGPG